jgi:ABC-type antimicrobial peptide transport system permease subunit
MNAPSPEILEAMIGLCEDPAATRKALEQENAVILYLPFLERDSETGLYAWASFDDADTWEPVDPGLAAGQTYTFSIRTNDDAGNDYEFTREIVIAGIIRHFPDDFLMTNNTALFGLSLFAGRSFFAGMCDALHFPEGSATGYTHVNIRLRDSADFSVRRSIAAIAQKRNGLIYANTYEVIEQAYRTGTQSIFLFGTAALLMGVMGMLLIRNIFLSQLSAEAANIGLFIAMGASRRGIRMQYWRRGLLLCAIGIACVTALAALTQWAIVDFHWTLGLMKIFAMGRGIDSVNSLVYPWAVHGLVCAAMAVYIMGMHIFSLKSVLKKSSVENMRGL